MNASLDVLYQNYMLVLFRSDADDVLVEATNCRALVCSDRVPDTSRARDL